jgi:hypothetical protein
VQVGVVGVLGRWGCWGKHGERCHEGQTSFIFIHIGITGKANPLYTNLSHIASNLTVMQTGLRIVSKIFFFEKKFKGTKTMRSDFRGSTLRPGLSFEGENSSRSLCDSQ